MGAIFNEDVLMFQISHLNLLPKFAEVSLLIKK